MECSFSVLFKFPVMSKFEVFFLSGTFSRKFFSSPAGVQWVCDNGFINRYLFFQCTIFKLNVFQIVISFPADKRSFRRIQSSSRRATFSSSIISMIFVFFTYSFIYIKKENTVNYQWKSCEAVFAGDSEQLRVIVILEKLIAFVRTGSF